MTNRKTHRLHILFNAKSMPYIYAAVHFVDGSEENQWWEKPFIVSKRRAGGGEMVYGTVKRTLERIVSQIDRLNRFRVETDAKLKAHGITPMGSGHEILPKSEVAHSILDEQDDLIEDVLLGISVNIRILTEIFPNKLKGGKVKVYNYHDTEVGTIGLRRIANLLLHNRYIVIRGHHVVDLFSDTEFMNKNPQMGLKIDFDEYLSEVEKVVRGLTVGDLASKLFGITKKLSPSSSMKDVVFLTQNLYTLGESVVGSAPTISDPLKTILGRLAKKHIDRMAPMDSRRGDTKLIIKVEVSTPRFYLEPDLDQKQIRAEVQVNGSPEKLVMGYEDFFLEVSQAFGNRRLYTKPNH